MLYEKDNYIYDFTYTSLDNEKYNNIHYKNFYEVLFSFEYKQDNIIDSEQFKVKKDTILKLPVVAEMPQSNSHRKR